MADEPGDAVGGSPRSAANCRQHRWPSGSSPSDKRWHELLADPTLADAICDRLVHNAHVIALQGPSMREKKGHQAVKPTTTR